ncbi:S66 peptidase family protein [Flavobacterium johnsoniae]|uniref:Peptidase family S66 n=1 Tax=Flavobacterium johnsoniae (strain ATCC 17061 / DSM 2064 / JCM 8514 / BCRC 14874 / CCUG 350202 / NBRC 14942 / NCIMB 11054 / UW101) TaxID=376686 RepID=A5FBG4_FLAJ1|nr:LD-carboxypeptidase [Flavobacterium johnsoniae]ABQ07462.1 peptidase family S66 [Flavobacterium johnsoniae UW101]OXE99363.1 LD-carboxypeptidase [Flavobacterium johnsoniae UW101]WQG80704.1 LD-carboxypeptidase [Flavobacterium johnsoniae UW101]SHL12376.1 muramoyltetrapeptide carboxypeptidase [Flavobacterium johnsoniae]
MITPPYLQSGDKVGILSPARTVSAPEIEEGLKILKSWNLEPVIGKNAYNVYGYFAGTDQERAEDLQKMLDDDTIKAIIFTRGGYRTIKIIDQLDFTNFKKNPKWIVGYSDITVLHSHIHALEIETIHAVMLQGMPRATPESVASIKSALFGESLAYKMAKSNKNKFSGNTVEGILVGGNLSLLFALNGSVSDINTAGKILFFEDLDEYLYHIDKALTALKRNNKLADLKAILVGAMTNIKEDDLPYGKTYYEIVLEAVREFDYPVYFDFPCGHQPDNQALILGRTVAITPDRDSVTVAFKN